MDEFRKTGKLRVGQPVYEHKLSGIVGVNLPPTFLGNVVSVEEDLVSIEFDNKIRYFKIVKEDIYEKYLGENVYSLEMIK